MNKDFPYSTPSYSFFEKIVFFGFFAIVFLTLVLGLQKACTSETPKPTRLAYSVIPASSTAASIETENTLTVGDATVVWKPNIQEQRMEYVKRFVATAVAEHKRFGVPASITLAQGILESNNGQSTLAKKANNHFGIKCFSHQCKKGHCINFTDDTHKDFFLKYRSAWYSYREHSKLLKNRYKHLFGRDTDGWAVGLQAAGYATSKTYARDLLLIINQCDLEKFDKI